MPRGTAGRRGGGGPRVTGCGRAGQGGRRWPVQEVRTLTGTGWKLKGNQAAFGQCGLVGDWWKALELHFVLDGPPRPRPPAGAGGRLGWRCVRAGPALTAARGPAGPQLITGVRTDAGEQLPYAGVGAGRGQPLEHGAARVRGHDGAEAGAADGGGCGCAGRRRTCTRARACRRRAPAGGCTRSC